jgi:hypothetical protein
LLKTLQTNVLYEQINKLLTNAAKIREIACVLRISLILCINNLFNQQLITIIMNKSELIDAIAADAGITAAAKLALESF